MNIRVFPFERECAEGYSFALGAIGYESRARYFFESKSPSLLNKAVCAFSEQNVLSYDANTKYFCDQGFSTFTDTHDGIRNWIASIKGNLTGDGQTPRTIVVDISSMTRLLISAICYELAILSKECGQTIKVDFVYSIAEFGQVPVVTGPLLHEGPVINPLGGWTSPGAPCAVILGIGYEEDLALGVVEELQAAKIWAFRPSGHDPKYDAAIDEKNRGLFDEIPAGSIIKYPVFDPFFLFASIEGLMALTKNEYSVIVVPFGPKFFALASTLGALIHFPKVGVWRASGGSHMEPVERKPLGPILGLTAHFLA
jgi:hypothetical protein